MLTWFCYTSSDQTGKLTRVPKVAALTEGSRRWSRREGGSLNGAAGF